MKILIVNPNSTVSMTNKIVASAQRIVGPNVELIARSGLSAPPSIEGHVDESRSQADLLNHVREAEQNGVDGVVVACFDDPGIGACRELATGPVLGICEAAMKTATMLATSFTVVTTLPRAIPIIEELARRYGVDHQCRRVRSAKIPVLALEDESTDARELIKAEILKAIEEDNCEAIVLGCAGMADLTQWLSQECGVPVIDGVVVAVKMVEALVGAGLKTSKLCAYAPPHTHR